MKIDETSNHNTSSIIEKSFDRIRTDFDTIFEHEEKQETRFIEIQPKMIDLIEERQKRKHKRNHLNDVDEINNDTNKSKLRPNNYALRLNRSTSYKMIERSKSTHFARTGQNKEVNKTSYKADDPLFSNITITAKASFALEDASKLRMKSVSPVRDIATQHKIEPVNSVCEKMSAHKDKSKSHIMKVFEVKNMKYAQSKASPITKLEPEVKESQLGDSDKMVTRLRSLRYKSINHSSSEDLYADTAQQEKLENESFRSDKESYNPSTSLGTHKSSVYSTNMIHRNVNSAISPEIKMYPRRKQPRQTKRYLDYSKEIDDGKATESDEEADAITNEDLGENLSKEAPFRQQVHETKSTLKLMKISSESPEIRDYDAIEIDVHPSDRSHEDHYQHYSHFEQRSK